MRDNVLRSFLGVNNKSNDILVPDDMLLHNCPHQKIGILGNILNRLDHLQVQIDDYCALESKYHTLSFNMATLNERVNLLTSRLDQFDSRFSAKVKDPCERK